MMGDNVYCYPGSDVLKNKMGIRDQDALRRMERRLTMLRILELVEAPLPGDFDFRHLKAIHRYIFQDVYDWAGEIRTVDIAKGNMFCNALFIESQAAEIFRKLKNDLQSPGGEGLTRCLAYHFSEINALHPFREGNGRCQREFIRALALQAGHVVHFAKAGGREEMLSASRASFLCDYGKMEQLFGRCIRRRG